MKFISRIVILGLAIFFLGFCTGWQLCRQKLTEDPENPAGIVLQGSRTTYPEPDAEQQAGKLRGGK